MFLVLLHFVVVSVVVVGKLKKDYNARSIFTLYLLLKIYAIRFGKIMPLLQKITLWANWIFTPNR